MDKNKELIKNTSIIFIGKFCTRFISFLLVPIYTNFLTTADYGYIDLVQTYISLLVPILILRLDSGIFRFLIEERNSDQGKNNIISNTILFLIFQIIIFIPLFVCMNLIFNINYAIAIIINIIFMSISSILLQLTRGIGDNVGYSISSIISGIITVILNIVFIIVLKKDGSSILIASGIANVFCSLFLIFRNKIYKFVNFKYFEQKKFKDMLTYSLPMIPDGLSWWVVNASDRSIISILIDSSANGIYAISSKFSNILSNLFQIFNMSWQESASLHIKDDDSKEFFTNVLNNTYKLFYSICTLIMVCIPIIFKFIIGKDYYSAYLYIPPLLLGNLYNAIANVIGGVYIAEKNTKAVARTTIVAAIINILINLTMIKKFGLFAASISTLVSYIILTIYRYIDVQTYLKIKLNYRILIITSIAFAISCIMYYINSIVFNIINFIFIIVLSIILNKNIIKKIITKFRRKEK